MPKYNIMDGEDVVGFIVLNKQQQPTFQHTTAGSLFDSGPVADGVLFLAVLGGITSAGMIGGFPGWVAAATGIGVTSALAGIRAWRLAPDIEEFDSEAPIRIEHYNDKGQLWLLDKIQDKSITPDDLRIVANRIRKNNFVWTKAATTKGHGGISNPKHDKIRDEFLSLGYIVRKPNNANGYDITRNGKAVIRAIK